MPSKINLVQPSFNSTGWNTPLNSNFLATSNGFGTFTNINVSSTDIILTPAQIESAGLFFSGTLTGNRIVYIPNGYSGSWIIFINISGSFTLSIFSDNGFGAPAGNGIVFQPAQFVNSYSIFTDSFNVNNSNSNNVFRSGDTMTGALNLPSNGLNVGSGQLQVTGGNVTTSGQFTAGNNVTAYSDERLKENIKPIERALNRVNAMRGVTFNTKKDGAPGVGFIAQEIQPLIPEAVYEDYAGYLHVAYGNITALLVNAINELTERVEKLENK